MRVGDVVGGRFVVERFAATGGMAAVYRATDQRTRETVALKVLTLDEPEYRVRFRREADALARVEHRGVVRYVDAGVVDDKPFLAMEWVDGETLAARLSRGRMTGDEARLVMASLAEGVGAIHRGGLLHRDLKPGNVILRGGRLDDAVVLDLGLARAVRTSSSLTRVGMVLGTIPYMSPERLRAPTHADPRSDVFALGCILYECLTGKRAHDGVDAPVVIGQVLFDETPIAPPRDAPLSLLAARMMRKAPDERPADASVVASMLERPSPAPSSTPRTIGTLTDRERTLASVLVAWDPQASDAPDDSTRARALCPEEVLVACVKPFGAALHLLGDDLAAVALAGGGTATDHALRAARVALAVRELAPRARFALATGRAESGAAVTVSDAFARAVRASKAAPDAGVRLDELTANLLGDRFETIDVDGAACLLRERAAPEPARKLLGRATPFVGREREMATLAGLAAEAFAEPGARVVTVTAPPGTGKSRLRSELAARIRVAHPTAQIWTALGDPSAKGSALALVRTLLEGVARLRTDDSLESKRAKLAARVAQMARVGAPDAIHFLGELVAAPFDDLASVKLRAARTNPATMAAQVRRAWLELIAAECDERPLAILLDDAHWGDAASFAFVEATAEACADRPLLLVVFGRPELWEAFPSAFEHTHARLGLTGLSRKASERFVRSVLDAPDESTVDRLVGQSEGNPFFLEELVRAEVKHAARPETVIAALGARLASFSADARKVARAAAIVGEVFWEGAVLELVGDSMPGAAVLAAIDELLDDEIFQPQSESRFSTQREIAFRHALLRDAAYAMVTDQDRATGHGVLAEWLERAGEVDARVLAHHHDLAGRRERAASFRVRAAEQALDANDLAGVLELCEQATPLVAGAERARLERVAAVASIWLGRSADTLAHARAALEHAEVGSSSWFGALEALSQVATWTQDAATVRWTASEVQRVEPDRVADRVAVARIALAMHDLGMPEAVPALVERARRGAPPDPVLDVLVNIAELSERHDLGAFMSWLRRSVEAYTLIGDERGRITYSVNLGYALNLAGAYAESEPLLRAALRDAEQLGLVRIAAGALFNLAIALLGVGANEDGAAMARRSREVVARAGDARTLGIAETDLARTETVCGRFDAALACATRAVELLVNYPAPGVVARGTLAVALWRVGRPNEAVDLARTVEREIDSFGKVRDDAWVRLEHARMFFALGHDAEGDDVLRRAAQHLVERRASLEEGLRPTFDAARVHRETMELARSRGVATGS